VPFNGFCGNSGLIDHTIRKYFSLTRYYLQQDKKYFKENISETGPAFLSDFKEMMTDFNTHEVNVIANGLEAINWSTLDNVKIILYRVIQELLVNMKNTVNAV
jgi:hypothetical protein